MVVTVLANPLIIMKNYFKCLFYAIIIIIELVIFMSAIFKFEDVIGIIVLMGYSFVEYC